MNRLPLHHPLWAAAALGAAFLTACGGGDDDLDAAVPSVTEVTSIAADEGYVAEHAVTLAAAPTAPSKYGFSTSGTATAADYGAMSFSNGVTYDAGAKQITVPAGVASFNVSYPVTFDALADAGETLIVKVGSASGTATLRDPADKYVGTWTLAQPPFGCESVANDPQHPQAKSRKTLEVFSKASHDEFKIGIGYQWFTSADCSGVASSNQPPSGGTIYKIFSPKLADGHLADRIQNGGMKQITSIRTEGQMLRAYPANGPEEDADGFPEHLNAKPVAERPLP